MAARRGGGGYAGVALTDPGDVLPPSAHVERYGPNGEAVHRHIERKALTVDEWISLMPPPHDEAA